MIQGTRCVIVTQGERLRLVKRHSCVGTSEDQGKDVSDVGCVAENLEDLNLHLPPVISATDQADKLVWFKQTQSHKWLQDREKGSETGKKKVHSLMQGQ